MSFSIDSTFGFHNHSSPIYDQYPEAKEKTKTTVTILNAFNGLGWIPIIGTIIGIARVIVFAVTKDRVGNSPSCHPKDKAFFITEIGRGVVEMLFLGFLLMIPDILFTIGRSLAYS